MAAPFFYSRVGDRVPRDVTHLIVGGSVRVVERDDFEDCEGLVRVEFREGVERIGCGVFRKCPNLECVYFPSSLITIGDYAFAQCLRLSKVILREGLEEIGMGAFQGCPNLERVDCPSSLARIEIRAFARCPRLSKVNLVEGLIWIGNGAFKFCGLQQITLPSSVMDIGQLAFANCDNLTAVSLGGEEGAMLMARSAFLNCRSLDRIAIPLPSMAVVVGAGEEGDGRATAATGGIARDARSSRLVLASRYLASMHPEDLANLTNAIDQIADGESREAAPLDLAAGDANLGSMYPFSDATDRIAHLTDEDLNAIDQIANRETQGDRANALNLATGDTDQQSMHPIEDLLEIDQIADGEICGAGALNVAAGDIAERIHACFVDRLLEHKREVASLLELVLWKFEVDRAREARRGVAAGGGKRARVDAPDRTACRINCKARPIVGLVLPYLEGPRRCADRQENA